MLLKYLKFLFHANKKITSNFHKYSIAFITIFISSNLLKADVIIHENNNKNFIGKTFSKEKKFNSKNPSWEIIDFKNQQKNKTEWKLLDKESQDNFNKKIKRELELVHTEKKININSLNRSIVINNDLFGPDVSWIVPLGFKWNSKYRFDTTIRGYSRRNNNQSFLNWNDGDGVGEIHYQILNSNKSSLGINLGIRSVYSGSTERNSPLGEGISAGFRFDKKISNSAGYSFGGEQLLHFDNLTDTGRNLYLSFSKAWLNDNNYSPFPLTIGTFGFGTGKLAEGTIKGLCTDWLGGSGTEIKYQRNLCWSPIFSVARVHNESISTFFEYNSKWFIVGTSLVPSQQIPLRGTFGIIISDHIDNYKLHNFNELRWVFRLNLGF